MTGVQITVRIVSELHPLGRRYSLVLPTAMAPGELAALHRTATDAMKWSRRRRGERALARAFRALGDAVSTMLPDLEPEVLDGLVWDDRVNVLILWSRLYRETREVAGV